MSLFGLFFTGLLIIRGKTIKISQDFQGQIRGKISRFCGILAEKNQISKDFQGQILRKIGRFHGKFRGELRQETISKKQPISLDFVLANFAKIDSIFASI